MSTPPSEFNYQYSIPVAVDSDFPSIFHPRINIAAGQADKVCLECRNDLSTAGCHNILEGCINPISGNAIALWFPEALPERLGIVAYMNEFGFLDDDIFENGQAEDFRADTFDEKGPDPGASTTKWY